MGLIIPTNATNSEKIIISSDTSDSPLQSQAVFLHFTLYSLYTRMPGSTTWSVDSWLFIFWKNLKVYELDELLNYYMCF